VQKKYRAILPEEVKEEIKKFVTHSGGMKKAAELLDVSPALIYAWLKSKSKISVNHATRVEEVTNGFCSSAILLQTRLVLKVNYASLKDFMVEEIIAKKVTPLLMSPEEYYDTYMPEPIKKLIEKSEYTLKDAAILSAFFGGDKEYWLSVLNNFQFV
jgi:DNA-binding transcriptional regulator YdaS (Cro superfamily)